MTTVRTLAVGRDDPARRCRNYRLRTNLFVCTVCRLCGRLGHVPGHIGCFVYFYCGAFSQKMYRMLKIEGIFTGTTLYPTTGTTVYAEKYLA